MTDEFYDDEKNSIIPGKETKAWSEMITRSSEAYWFVKCPDCNGIHPRIVTEYWQKEPPEEGGFTACVVSQHCFYCDAVNRHYRIDAMSPFDILGEIPMPVMKVYEPDIDDEKINRLILMMKKK